MRQRQAGTPWLARGAADVLSMLDPTAWIGVFGLLDECPIVPEALTAVREVRKKHLSAENPPASTLVGVAALAVPDWLIEIEVVAVLPG